jgi:hypothetical protein
MHEETFNILSHQGNANQNDTEIPSHSNQNGNHQEKPTKTNTGENVGKKAPLYTVGGSVNYCSQYGNQYGGCSEN